MFRIIYIALFSIASATPTLADGAGPKGSIQPSGGGQATLAADSMATSQSDTAQGSIPHLRLYGERFQAAINQIEAAAELPDWGWEDDCSHPAHVLITHSRE